MATKYTFTVRFLKYFFGPITVAMALALTACTDDFGEDGFLSIFEDDEEQSTNQTSTSTNKNSPNNTPNNQTIAPPKTNTTPANTISEQAWRDSVRRDSIQKSYQRELDSLHEVYDKMLIDSTSENTQSSSETRTLLAEDIGITEIYGAFANQYSLLYRKEIQIFDEESGETIAFLMPFPIGIENICDSITKSCNKRRIMIKSWISGFTDTATITRIVSQDTILTQTFKFHDDALIALTSPKQAQRQIEAYELDSDKQNLFYSESKTITIYPMQFFGSEPYFYADLYERIPSLYEEYEDPRYWISAWVTPWADSISNIVKEVARKLPNGNLKVYQQYVQDTSIEQSCRRVVGAIFEVLQSRNIKYVQDAGATGLLIGQKINYPVETLRKKQGICIETATLFASILERIGFKTAIIFIPGHAFVGWFDNSEKEVLDLIETTYIGNKSTSWADAINAGLKTFREQKELGNFISGNAAVIRIDYAREMGILPNDIP